jgi:hypothetical protein
MRPSAARAGEHLVFADIQLRTVGPQFVEKQLSEAAQLLLVPDECVTERSGGLSRSGEGRSAQFSTSTQPGRVESPG